MKRKYCFSILFELVLLQPPSLFSMNVFSHKKISWFNLYFLFLFFLVEQTFIWEVPSGITQLHYHAWEDCQRPKEKRTNLKFKKSIKWKIGKRCLLSTLMRSVSKQLLDHLWSFLDIWRVNKGTILWTAQLAIGNFLAKTAPLCALIKYTLFINRKKQFLSKNCAIIVSIRQ